MYSLLATLPAIALFASVTNAQADPTFAPGSKVVLVGMQDTCLLDEVTANATVIGCHSTAPQSITWTLRNGTGVDGPIQFPLDSTQTDCLTVVGPVQNGAIVAGQPCVGGSQGQWQQWHVRQSTVRLSGTNFCLDITDGDATFGNRVQLWTCAVGNSNQVFVPATPPPGSSPSGFQPGSTSVGFQMPEPIIHETGCLFATSNTDGASVVLNRCFSPPSASASRNWTLTAGSSSSGKGPAGTLVIFGNKCLDLTNGSSANGNKLQIWTCATGNTNQRWQVNGDQTISWAGGNKCVDNTDGNLTDGNRAQVWDCDATNPNQVWTPSQFFD